MLTFSKRNLEEANPANPPHATLKRSEVLTAMRLKMRSFYVGHFKKLRGQ
jgi:hypothetical protein